MHIYFVAHGTTTDNENKFASGWNDVGLSELGKKQAKEGDIVTLFIGETDQEPQLMEPEKFSEWKWCGLDNIPENFINPAALSLIKEYYKI